MPDPAQTEAQRVIAGRYRLDRSIARGSTSEVFAAHDETLGRPVAVKVLHPHLAGDPAVVERFRREAVVAARLNHPNVVETYDAGVEGSDAYVVMEVAAGRPLSIVLTEQRELSMARAVKIASQVAAALDEAHRHGIVHRGLQPSDVLVADDDRVKVADLGITGGAVAADPPPVGPDDPTRAGEITRSPVAYRSPEQLDGGDAGPASDIYALGVILYEMICGAPPFRGRPGIAAQQATEPPLPPRQVRAGVPRALDEVVLRALAKAPADRFPTAADMQSALLSVDVAPDDAVPMVVRDPTPPGGVDAIRFRQTERSWLWPTVLIVVVAVTLGIVGVLFATTDTAQRLFNRETGNSANPPEPAGPATVTRVELFDPDGDGDEHNDELSNLLDEEPSTTWLTHQYLGQPFGGLKDGVGVVFHLEDRTDISSVEIDTPTAGWSVDVYVAAGTASSLEAWGDPVAAATDLRAGEVSLDLDSARGRFVLVWISDPGPDNQVYIGGIRLIEA